jgi:hypothetical protein
LYAIITPDDRGDGAVRPEVAAQHEQPTSCDIGQWVTVTKDDGVVPSMSVSWRRVETLITSWSNRRSPLQRVDDHSERTRETGFAILAAAFRSAAQSLPQQPDPKDWTSRTDAVVAR